ncbi:MAG: redox-regulated ATPase YchF [Verrucomicrobiales bacterium]
MLQAGIVGLPNVGKSTLFNAVTRSRKAEAANYPFCTIEPNQGVVTVPDERLEVLAKLSRTQKIVPAAIEFVDIAGLVKGASQGEGLGNKFLSHIREVDAIVQVVRCFESGDIHHVAGSIDAIRDIETITTELILADIATLEKQRATKEKKARVGDAESKAEIALIDRLLPHLNEGKPALTLEVSDAEGKCLKSFFLLTSKPTIFACNVAEDDLGAATSDPESNPHVAAVMKYARDHHEAEACVISAAIEEEMIDLTPSEAAEYLAGLGATSSGVSNLIKAVYHLLGLRTYLTTGEKETRAWTFTAGMTASQCAGVIHSDFERGFIAGEVVPYSELVAAGSFAKCKENGTLRIVGKDYLVQDGDVVEWRFNV